MYKSILVPLDGSSAAEIVLQYAEEIAAKFNSEIILLNVSPPAADDKDRLYRSYLEGVAKSLQGRLEVRMDKDKVRVRTEVVFGKSASEILRYADESNVSLIAMASRGLSGQGPRGGTIQQCLRYRRDRQ